MVMLERYFKLAGIKGEQDKFLFRGLVTTKNGSWLRNTGGLSYTRAREVVLDMLEAIGLDKRQVGLHSLRAGGASAAANAGVYLIGSSSSMGGGGVKMLRIGM